MKLSSWMLIICLLVIAAFGLARYTLGPAGANKFWSSLPYRAIPYSPNPLENKLLFKFGSVHNTFLGFTLTQKALWTQYRSQMAAAHEATRQKDVESAQESYEAAARTRDLIDKMGYMNTVLQIGRAL
jgi:hypothetical protein